MEVMRHRNESPGGTGRVGYANYQDCLLSHFDGGHHHEVFVFEVVAVDDIFVGLVGEADCCVDDLAGGHADRVLPDSVTGQGLLLIDPDEGLEGGGVEVDRMVRIGSRHRSTMPIGTLVSMRFGSKVRPLISQPSRPATVPRGTAARLGDTS